MHNNYYFLRQISERLTTTLVDSTLVSSFSQNKDELVLEFNNGRQSFFIKASLQAELSCLTFPAGFNRAKSNSVDIFQQVMMKKVTGVRQYRNERSFLIQLEGDCGLLFKMHGHRANILQIEAGRVVSIFRNHLKADFNIDPNAMDRDIDWSREAFIQHVDHYKKLYFTFGKEVAIYLREKGFEGETIEQKWDAISSLVEALGNPSYYIIEDKGTIHFSLVPFATIRHQLTDPFKAINTFSQVYWTYTGFHREKDRMAQATAEARKNAVQYIQSASEKLEALKQDNHFEQWANLLMANLGRVGAGVKSVVLNNFYDADNPVEIKLNDQLTPQKNAEVYYRKAKNRVIEVTKLEEAIARKQKEADIAAGTLAQIQGTATRDDLRGIDFVTEEKEKEKKSSLPYRLFEFRGFDILVGKDAKANDELTLKHTMKEDLWLHARDVAGSHVVIKHQSGKQFPAEVIERAAQLAGFYSKRKNESLCPVIVTPKKFVRKRKGDPPGSVVVEREKVLMVEPKGLA